MRLVGDEAHRKQQQIESRQRLIIGVNKFVDEDVRHLEVFRASREMRERQLRRLAEYRASRDHAALERSLALVREAAGKGENVMGPTIEALRVRATEGEVIGTLKQEYGEHQPETAF